jgi:L-aminopeptidase/D-esterase-like protein
MAIMTQVEHRWEALDGDIVVAFATTQREGDDPK